MSVELKDEERQECEVWSRCMCYHSPNSEWNKGKRGEWEERKFFKEPKTKETK